MSCARCARNQEPGTRNFDFDLDLDLDFDERRATSDERRATSDERSSAPRSLSA
ncbi:MAG: hypothetical protein HKO82_01815 [Acidimicrobiia bacterium]|nr:hypothetical protein [Acidimicrobiia bacterium]